MTILYESKNIQVEFMVNPSARFVSLVDRGANQTPFKIVAKEDINMSGVRKVIQKLFVPAGADLTGIAGFEPGMFQVQKVGEHDVYTGLSDAAFVPGSFEMVKFDILDTGIKAQAFVGTPVDGAAAVAADITGGVQEKADKPKFRLFTRQKPKVMIAVKSGPGDADQFKADMAYEVWEQLDAATSIARGALVQDTTAAEKLSLIKKAFENLYTFMEANLTDMQKAAGDKPFALAEKADSVQDANISEAAPAVSDTQAPGDDSAPAVLADKKGPDLADVQDTVEKIMSSVVEQAASLGSMQAVIESLAARIETVSKAVSAPSKQAPGVAVTPPKENKKHYAQGLFPNITGIRA